MPSGGRCQPSLKLTSGEVERQQNIFSKFLEIGQLLTIYARIYATLGFSQLMPQFRGRK